ncbi:four helix bundle protein [Maribacter sp. 2304DJ31-5]|uniref:four helix bundle protein n=1 Tax=Maribacter sp. 2304DJ31-5 TaxID=3386273 RepID=UPI0039BCC974
MTHNFRKLKVWNEGISLVNVTYRMTKNFPDIEKFNLTSQMIRCAVSIPSNIAEGSSKGTNKHFGKFLEISLGSAFEWETQLIIAFNQGYLTDEKFKNLEQRIRQLQKMTSGFQGGLDK